MAKNQAPGVRVPARRILDRGVVGLLLAELDGTAIYVNNALAEILGYSAEELIGCHTPNLVHPDDRERITNRLRGMSGGFKDGYQVERRYLRKDGTVVPALSSVKPLNDARGNPKHVIIQITDLTAQKKTEQALEESQDRWHFALDSARQGVWDNNLVTNGFFHSSMWREMRGLAPDEDVSSIGEWESRVHPDDLEETLKNTDWRNGSGEYNSFEYREWHRDGYWMWVLARGRPIEWDENGVPTRVIGTDTDITHLKKSEQALEVMSRRLELALSASKVGVWEIDLDTWRFSCDLRLAEIFGVPHKAGISTPIKEWRERIHPDDRAQVMSVFKSAIREGGQFENTFSIFRPDGTQRHITTAGTYYLDKDGKPKILGADRDITDEVQAAEALQQAKELAEDRNTELEAARAEMEHASLHDALTGLPNRRYLDTRLSELSMCHAGAALLHIDLDRFKQINDTLGHAAGDAMLVHAAEVLRSNLSEDDFIARVGGDEFVVLISGGASNEELAKTAGNIVRTMSEPVTYNEHQCRFGVSVGIASAESGLTDAAQLFVNADIALYRAKAKGRNRFEFFTSALQAEIISTKKRADEILYALEQGQFFPTYQPKFDADGFAICGVEALARWAHPTEGVLPPAAFLKIAEDLNVVASIDRVILEKSLADLERWHANGLDIPSVSVNVSALRLHDDELIDHLGSMSWRPGTLSFELLESIFLDESEEIVTWNIDRIKEMGIGIDVDDFGTGHASIVGLLKLAPDSLKIDRQLVSPITQSQAQRELVKSIINIGHSLGIRVVAEGVETQQHVTILQELGCDVLQGFFFSRPMSAAELEAFAAGDRQTEVS